MQPNAYPVRHDILKQFWLSFMETGQAKAIRGHEPDPAVVQSWRRCAPRSDPRSRPRLSRVKEQSLASILKAQTDFITIATPFVEDIHQFIEGSGCAILLTDGTACVLTVGGDPAAVKMVQRYGLGQGTYWSEGPLGTNALGMALITAMPVQVIGAEHYFRAYHHLVTTAAPIHDIRGRIIGIIAIVGPVETAASHTLALVMAAARAISNQLQTNLYLEEANRRLSEVNTILEAIVEGIITWNETGQITHVNSQAARILNLNPVKVLGEEVSQVLNLPLVLQEAIAKNSELRDVEVEFHQNGQAVHALVRLCPIFEGSSQAIGYIAMLRPIEYVRQLVHQQVGTQATLTLEDIAAQSAAMRAVTRQARTAARGVAPVMLRGEGGVGKNHLARAIHNDSKRADKPFIAINCQAIPHELMIGEFLGYEKDGAATGRPSKFELADGGTLMFDHIESLSLEMQAVLVHVIETGHVMRLGGIRPIPVNVRIIAATSADLERYVADGSFNSLLYYRFGVFNITVPPLRDRIEDIPLLAERFLARITERSDHAVWIDDEALKVLRRYPWPGNVREFESVLERALNQSRDNIIRVTDLPEAVRNGRLLTATSPQPLPVLSAAEAEREAILRAGWACNGHVTEMAQQLGLGRTTLWRKMKRLNISPNHFKTSSEPFKS